MNNSSQVANFSEESIQQAIDSAPETVRVEITTPEPSTPAPVVPEIIPVALLQDNAKMQDVIKKVNELVQLFNEQRAKPATVQVATRDRGPVSERTATEDDARKFMLGEYSAMGHKEAAQKLGLSYGQIYSARKGFTFKKIYAEATKAGKKW